jgi:hypothetical protein
MGDFERSSDVVAEDEEVAVISRSNKPFSVARLLVRNLDDDVLKELEGGRFPLDDRFPYSTAGCAWTGQAS